MTIQRWGGLAFFLLVVALVVPPGIHLFGDLRTPIGPFAYDLADFLFGPVWAASLVTGVLALRESFAAYAPRRMSLSLLAAVLAAAAMVTVACFRSANRHYHLSHPELNLEAASSVIVVWTTIIAGVYSAGWHFLGWVLLLVGSSGWTSRRLPRLLSALCLAAGTVSLFVYFHPTFEHNAVPLAVAVSIWLGILLLRAPPAQRQAPASEAGHPA